MRRRNQGQQVRALPMPPLQSVLALLSVLTLCVFLSACNPFASDSDKETAKDTKTESTKKAGDGGVAGLMDAGPLKEMVLGDANAPVTIVEYASMTCGHCASFHKETLPGLKKKYIDTGKVRLIFREFPLDNLAVAASMAARCAGDEKYFPLVGGLFAQQENWAFGEGDPVPRLFSVVKQIGMKKEDFDACIKDEELAKKIVEIRTKAHEKFGVKSTPSFFVNGIKYTGAPSLDAFEKVIDPLIASPQG